MKFSDTDGIKKIESFRVDHRKLEPGFYLSRTDGDIKTFDLRFKKPNNGDYLTNVEAHTMEHMFATYIRNSDISHKVIYFGPMGCMTGFYLLLKDVSNEEALNYTKETLEKIISHKGDVVFGADEEQCGNYRCLEMSAAKRTAEDYLNILQNSEKFFDYD